MKKKELKEILVSSIKGIPFGVTMLMIAYIGVYFIGGQNVFEDEIDKLKDIKTLLTQIIILGISYYIFSIEFELWSKVEKDTYKVTCIIMLFLSEMLFMIINEVNSEISDNICVINIVISNIVFCLNGAIVIFKSDRNEYLINKKIQEKNNL